MDRRDPGDKVGQIEGNPVEHDHGEHFIDTPFCLQKTDYHTPDRTRGHGGEEAQRDQYRLGKAAGENADHGGSHGTDNKLTFRPDIEDTGLKGKRDRKTDDNIGDGIDNHIGKAFD